MNKRLIFFIIMLLTAILSSFGQEIELTQNLTPPPAPAMEEPKISPAIDSAPTSPDQEVPTVAMPIRNLPSLQIPRVEVNLTQEQVTDISEPIPQGPLEKKALNIGLSAEIRQKVASMLNKLLSDEYVLYTKTLKFHWNVQGLVFHSFHEMFKQQYEQLFEFIDLIAERARALGAPALGSLEEFKTYTQLTEAKNTQLTPLQMVQELLNDYETIIRTMRSNIEAINALNDQGTSNFLQDLLIKHEKIAWMLRATAQ